MAVWGYAVMAAVCLLALGAAYGQHRRTRRTLETLSRMLDAAMQGDFTEDSFDETLLSALESKLAHYLAASTTSARQVAAEKEKLKSLIGDISHQTKTPMAVQGGCSSSMEPTARVGGQAASFRCRICPRTTWMIWLKPEALSAAVILMPWRCSMRMFRIRCPS